MPALVLFFCCDKIPDKNNLKEEGLFYLRVSDILLLHGKEGMAEQNSSPHSGQ
jgi:hypothetical protein